MNTKSFDGHHLVDEEGAAAIYKSGRSFLMTLDGDLQLRGAESTVRSFYAGVVVGRKSRGSREEQS